MAKKRGRKSQSGGKAVTDKDDDERPAKKPRKSSDKKTTSRGARSTTPPVVPDEEEIGNMAEHMHAPTWDQLIKQIDTVERADDKLYVYFTLYVRPDFTRLRLTYFAIRANQEWRRAHPGGFQDMCGQVPENGTRLSQDMRSR